MDIDSSSATLSLVQSHLASRGHSVDLGRLDTSLTHTRDGAVMYRKVGDALGRRDIPVVSWEALWANFESRR